MSKVKKQQPQGRAEYDADRHLMVSFQLRVPPSLKEAMEKASRKESRTQTALVNLAIRHYLNAMGHDCPPIQD